MAIIPSVVSMPPNSITAALETYLVRGESPVAPSRERVAPSAGDRLRERSPPAGGGPAAR